MQLNYLPVNIKRTNCAIYSNNKIFPEELLRKAYAFATGNVVEDVYEEEGCISFMNAPEYRWAYSDIYLAFESYKTAVENNFSYFMVTDHKGVPLLFVSKSFSGNRVLVNAMSMQGIIVTKKALLNKVVSLIDKRITFEEAADVFDTIFGIETCTGKFLTALICYKGTANESLSVSPVATTIYRVSPIWGTDVIEDLALCIEGRVDEQDTWRFEGDKLIRVGLEHGIPPISIDFAKSVITIHKNVSQKKSNYIEICNEDYMPALYFSTNKRYLVNAKTFECVIVNNQNLIKLLNSMSGQHYVKDSLIHLAWRLAKMG